MRPSIYQYENYRLFLRDSYAFLKNRTAGFSYRTFSKKAGFTAPNVLKLVMEGDRGLTQQSIAKFAIGLGLRRSETNYFRTLVLFNQASTVSDKQKYYEELTRFKRDEIPVSLQRPEYVYLTQWYYVAVRELMAHPGFQEDPDWISRHLVPRVGASEVKVALEVLEQIGLARRNSEGKLEQSQSVLSTDDEVASILVRRFHEQMIQMGQQAIDRFPSVQREISGTTLLISKPTFLELKKRVQEFRAEMMELVQAEQGGDQVYQFNFQLFPLSKANE